VNGKAYDVDVAALFKLHRAAPIRPPERINKSETGGVIV
jgi:hypothetical protein